MSKKIIFIALILTTSSGLYAQEKPKSDNWTINEVYTSDKPKRYGLFLELYNSADSKVPDDLYISDSKKNPQQARLSSKGKYNPDLRKKNYRTFKVSSVRFKRRSIRLYGSVDTLYLFKRVGYEYIVKDSFPVIWNDSLSLGKCGNRICYFNVPTPGRPNKNISPVQYMPRKGYRAAVFGGFATAANAGNGVGNTPAFTVRAQKFTNKRIFYLTTSAALSYQGYSFKRNSVRTTSTGTLTTLQEGNHYVFALWGGKDAGLFLTPRLDIHVGAAWAPVTIMGQNYDEKITLVQPDGTILEDSYKQKKPIGRYDLPVVSFNGGLNYQLTSRLRIETLYTLLFRTFQKNETVYFQSFSIGLSRSFMHKGRGYREGLLW